MSAWSYRPSLDGLRMLAMYIIVLFHTEVPWIKGGFIAVNLFFVLSGYLVTNVVLSEMDRTGTVRLGNFYARRVRRLLPAALVAITATCVLFVLIAPVARRVSIIGDAQSALLYFANWRFIAQANDYFATNVDKSPFLHFWTLSIEEQFYVAFPVLLLALAWLGRRLGRSWVMFAGLSLVCLASVVAQFYWADADAMHAYYGTDARLYQLAVGAVLAVGLRNWPVRVPERVASAAATVGMVSFLVLCLNVVPMSRPVRGLLGTLACVVLIGGLMLAEKQPLGRLLSARIPVYLGTISYATYLWHWPAVLALGQVLKVGPVSLAVLAGVIATAMAAVSAEVLELPIRRAKRLDPFRWRTALVGVSCSALVAVTVVPWVLQQNREPALVAADEVPHKSGAAEAAARTGKKPESVPKDVDWKKIDRDKGQEYTCTAADVSKCIVHRGSGPKILVIGDSHARMMSQMFADLAKEHDFTLAMNDVAGCPWQENLKNTQSPKPRQEECTKARVGWYDKVLPKLDPDLVVVTSFPRDNTKHWTKRLQERDDHGDALHRSILRATRQTLGKIDRVAERTLMVQTIVAPLNFDPNDCLTSTSDARKCSVTVPGENRPTDGFYLAEAAQSDDFYTVDLNPAFCPDDPVCDPVWHGQIVWRDKHHLTPQFAAKRKDKVWDLIRKTGVLKGFKGV